MENTISLLDNIIRNADRDQFYEGNLRGIAKSYLSFFASSYHNHKKSVSTDDSRPWIITRAFFDQLHANFKTVKSPSEYASLLSITPAYLNETVKDTTGKTISLWIKERVITEAKRILSHTQLSIKEVSLELGGIQTALILSGSSVNPLAKLQASFARKIPFRPPFKIITV